MTVATVERGLRLVVFCSIEIVGDRPSIAVLPFGNLGNDPDVGGCGIIFLFSNRVVAERNYMQDTSDSSLKAEACSDITYRGNWVVDSGKDAIKAGSYTGFPTIDRVVMVGNIVQRIQAWRPDGSSLMLVYDAKGVVINGNVLVGGGNRVHATAGTLPEDGIRVINQYSTYAAETVVSDNVITGVANAGVRTVSNVGKITVADNRTEGWIELTSTGPVRVTDNTVTRASGTAHASQYGILLIDVQDSATVQDNTVRHYYGGCQARIKGGATVRSVRLVGNEFADCYQFGAQITNLGSAATVRLVEMRENALVDPVTGPVGFGVGLQLRCTNLTVTQAVLRANTLYNSTAVAVNHIVELGGDATGSVALLDIRDNVSSGAVATPVMPGKTNAVRIIGHVDTLAPVFGTWAVGDKVESTAPTAGGSIGWVCTTAGSPGTWKTYGAVAA